MTDEKLLGFICRCLRLLAWALLLTGIVTSFALSAFIAPLILLTRWSGVVVLACFILVFLFIHLGIITAQMVLSIKKKVIT